MGGRKVGMGGALCCIKNGDTSVAAIYHFKYKSKEEFHQKSCVRGRIFKHATSNCGRLEHLTGEIFDDTVWRTLQRIEPKYAALYPNEFK
jgi:hypothetical protein